MKFFEVKNMKTITKYFLIIILALSPLAMISAISAQTGSNYAFLLKWGEPGTGDGQFDGLFGIALDSSNNVYVADSLNDRIQKFSSTGTFLLKWGTTGTTDGRFRTPWCLALDSNDNVYVADSLNDRIQKFSSMGTFLIEWGTTGIGAGQFDRPFGVAVDSNDYVYVTDFDNNRVQKFNSTGSFIASWGTLGTGDGEFDGPRGIAIDSDDNVYVGDYNNYRIQKFDSEGTYITKWGTSGTGDGQFSRTQDLCVDPDDNVFVADLDNNRVQKFSSTGTFILTWGTLGTADGQFNGPAGVASDPDGNIYVTDFYNNRVQKFSPPDTTAPTINIIAPQENAIVSDTQYGVSSIPLTFTVSEDVSWMGISVNGQANSTISGNITLYDLPDGPHNAVVYANDTAGNMASATVHFTVDINAPNIMAVSQNPTEDNVLPTDEVEVNATVTDATSGVKQVILNYTNGEGTWITVDMTNLEENVWNGAIPSFPDSTNVTYVVTAEDNANNIITTEEVFGYEYKYSVIPEFPSLIILPLSMITTLIAIILYRKKHTTLH
jgi:streptogramin lyase